MGEKKEAKYPCPKTFPKGWTDDDWVGYREQVSRNAIITYIAKLLKGEN